MNRSHTTPTGAPSAAWPRRLCLQRISEGWALVDDGDRPVFESRGRNARRRCLDRARARGVLQLTFGEQLRAA